MEGEKAPAIGIDLGTTYSCVGVFQNGGIVIIDNEQGYRTTPSYVAYNDIERLIGYEAKAQTILNPENTVYDAKRLIGRKYDDPEIQKDLQYWTFQVIDEGGMPKVSVQYKGKNEILTPEEISAAVLSKMKIIAERYLGKDIKVTDAVVTVPAYFNDSQRQATIDAGKIAGLNVLQILSEPTAASLAYGLQKKLTGQRNVLIYDLGGGTFDVSIMNIVEGCLFEAQVTSGDTHLGGGDFDSRLVDHFVSEFKFKYKKDLRSNKTSVQRLREACEIAKRNLSSTSRSTITIYSLFEGITFISNISRACFENLCIDLFKMTLLSVEKALKDANMDKSSIDDVVLVGGSTRIPKIQKLLKEFFDGKDLTMSINPDEAVAYGAAVRAALLTGNTDDTIKDVLMVDVTPLSLGIQVGLFHSMSNVIERNTKIPCKKSKYFTTVEDNQTVINIVVYEGERPVAKDNHCLGSFRLSGLAPAPHGVANIDVTFNLDANNILTVSAIDQNSNKSESITIKKDQGRLNRGEILWMLQQAKRFEMEDQLQREKFASLKSLEDLVYSVKQTAESTCMSTISSYEKAKVKTICGGVISWLDENMLAGKDVIERKKKEVESELSSIMKKLNL